MCGPTGVGILWQRGMVKKITYYKGGGEMITTVTFEKQHMQIYLINLETGTPNICGGCFGTQLIIQFDWFIDIA
jgi:cysteine desulfurase/selenocysteine lyase